MIDRSRLLRFLRSPRLAVSLMLVLAALAAGGSFLSPGQAERHDVGRLLHVARRLGLADIYRSPLFLGCVALLAANILACTLKRLPAVAGWSGSRSRPPRGWRPWLDVLSHLSIIVLLAGSAVKGAAGFTGTQYLFPMLPVDKVYDPRLGTDVPLGFVLLLKEKVEEYYPLSVRIGVSRGDTGEKLDLVELLEGRGARAAGRGPTLFLEGPDREGKGFWLRAVSGGRDERLWMSLDPADRTSREAGDYRLTLVGFRRDLKTVRSRVAVLEGEREVKEEWLVPNSRVSHRGASLYLVGWGADKFGNEYLGIQVTRDPGAFLFWFGAVLFCLALPGLMLARRSGHGSGSG